MVEVAGIPSTPKNCHAGHADQPFWHSGGMRDMQSRIIGHAERDQWKAGGRQVFEPL